MTYDTYSKDVPDFNFKDNYAEDVLYRDDRLVPEPNKYCYIHV